MKQSTRSIWTMAMLGVAMLSGAPALAQPHDATPAAPKDKAGAAATDRVGDPYPLATCPISGKALGDMGDPIVKVYDGREIRYCCNGCPGKFEKDLAASMAKLDEKLIKDQAPLYPIKTSLVTGKDLPEKAYEFVYGNRLIRLGAESEKAEFMKAPKKYMEALNLAVIAAQGGDYPLDKCPVSGDELDTMGKPQELVIAGRLIRLCCNDCRKDVEANPAKFIAMVDEARRGGAEKAKDGAHGDAAQPHHPK